MVNVHNIEDLRNYAHRGAEVKTMTLGDVQDGKATVIFQKHTCDVLLLSREGHILLTATTEFDAHFNAAVKISDLRDRGLVGELFGMEVYTDAFLKEEKRFVTGLGRVMSFPEFYNQLGE